MASSRPSASATFRLSVTKSIILVAFVTLMLMTEPFACLDTAESDVDAQEQESTTCVDSSEVSTDTEIAEGSRATGGSRHTPFPWLMNLWASQVHDSWDGRFVGFGLRLTKYSFIAADVSCLMMDRFYQDHNKSDFQFDLHSPEKINVNVGYEGKHRKDYPSMYGCAYHHSPRTVDGENLGFSVFNFRPNFPNDPTDERLSYNSAVPLQNDASVKTDCYLYAYSSNLDPAGRPQEIRYFSKIPVILKECPKTRTYCKFVFPPGQHGHGLACPWLSDVGAPVVCRGKVSYIVGRGDYRPSVDKPRCVTAFYAFMVEPFRDDFLQ